MVVFTSLQIEGDHLFIFYHYIKVSSVVIKIITTELVGWWRVLYASTERHFTAGETVMHRKVQASLYLRIYRFRIITLFSRIYNFKFLEFCVKIFLKIV